MTPVRLEPAAPWSRVKHSTTDLPVKNLHKMANHKTKILMTNGNLMKIKSVAERSPGAFCNTFDLHLAISGLETNFCLLFEWPLKTGFTVDCHT